MIERIAMNRVKEYRKQKGLSQMALAKRIDVARQLLPYWYYEKYNPSLDLCLKLAHELDTDLNTLLWDGDV